MLLIDIINKISMHCDLMLPAASSCSETWSMVNVHLKMGSCLDHSACEILVYNNFLHEEAFPDANESNHSFPTPSSLFMSGF